MNLKNITKYLLWAIIVIITFLIACEVQKYKFQDCKKVGHTELYCWLNLGK